MAAHQNPTAWHRWRQDLACILERSLATVKSSGRYTGDMVAKMELSVSLQYVAGAVSGVGGCEGHQVVCVPLRVLSHRQASC